MVPLTLDKHNHNWDDFYSEEDDVWYWPEYGTDRAKVVAYADAPNSDPEGYHNGYHDESDDSYFFMSFNGGTFRGEFNSQA